MDYQEMSRRAESVQEKANVKAAFGEPQQIGDRTIIPVAQVAYGYGFGGGFAPAKAEGEAAGQQPGGGGAGAGARVKPLGALVVSSQGVKFEPTLDVVSMAIAGMLLAAWNVFWITMTVRRFGGARRHRIG